MTEKAKKQRLIIAGLCALSLIIAIALAVVSFSLIRDMNYVPMWFTLGISVVCCYLTVFFAFMALDRNTAIRFCRVAEECEYNVDEIAKKMGWKKKATARFYEKCVKWGIINKN